jgi:hypothetical protein
MNEQGPVIDWLRAAWGRLIELIEAMVHLAESVASRIEGAVSRRIDSFEWKIALLLLALVAVHAWVTRPRK